MQKHFVVLSLLLSAACGPAEYSPDFLDDSATSRTDAEHWTKQDDPKLFGLAIEYNLRALPLEGRVGVKPWVGSYWPVVRDSINYRWDHGRASAAAKYGQAFGVGSATVEDYVSSYHGVDSFGGGGYCSTSNDCGTGSGCGHHAGAGKCIPNWWGICDAWAAAAILTPEPMHPVVYNGVTFKVADIKGLVTLVHKKTEAKHVALRCYTNGVLVDGAGRPQDAACRDANPGTYHLLLANMLGLKGNTFIEDRSTDMDVWNHPVTHYKVKRMQVVTDMQANNLLGIGNAFYPYNDKASRLVYVENEVTVMKEDFIGLDGHLDPDAKDKHDNYKYKAIDLYKYILELDANNRIIGGEWVAESKWKHPDFLWLPLRAKGEPAAGGKVRYEDVMAIARQSYDNAGPGAPPTTNPSRPGRGNPPPIPPEGAPPSPDMPQPNPDTPETPVPQPQPPTTDIPPSAPSDPNTNAAYSGHRRHHRRHHRG